MCFAPEDRWLGARTAEWLLSRITHDDCDNGVKPVGQSEFFRNAWTVEPRQWRTDPTRTQRACVCRQYEVLRSAAAVEGCLGIASLSAKQNQGRRVPKDLEVRLFSPRPGMTFRLMLTSVLLGTSAIARKALHTFNDAQSPRRCAAYRWSGSLNCGIHQLLDQRSIDGIRAVPPDGPSRVNGFEDIHCRLPLGECDAYRPR